MNAKLESALLRFHALDLLATPVAVLNAQGLLIFSNAALEDVIGQSRRSLEGLSLDDYFADPLPFFACSFISSIHSSKLNFSTR